MKKFLVGLRSVGILLGVWLVLGVVALVAGVFPDVNFGASGAASHGPESADAGAADAGDAGAASAQGDAGANGSIAGADAGPPQDAATATSNQVAAAPVPRVAAQRLRVCASDVFEPVLAVVDVLHSGAGELAIGCGDTFSLLTVEDIGEEARISRVARFTLSNATPGTSARAADVATGDIDMDGRVDLLFGFVLTREGQGGMAGGALDWVGRDPNSGFTPGRRLAPIAATRVMLADVDGSPGADPIALNATDPHGRRLSEVWVFGGGAAPERRAKLDVGRGGLDFALLDLDGDEHLDLATLSIEEPKLRIFFGDGAGSFDGPTTLSPAAGTRLTGATRQATETAAISHELLVSGGGWSRVAAGAREQVAVQALTFADPERAAHVEGLAAASSDGDLDVVGLSGHDLVAPTTEPGAERMALRVVRSFPATFLPLRFAVGEIDGRRGVDLAVLGRGTEADAPLELVIVSDLFFDAAGNRDGAAPARTIALSPTLSPLRDAPLSLRVVLP